MTTDYRLEALHHADHTAGTPEEVVARAQAYYAFLTSTSADAAAPTAKTTTAKKDTDKPKAEEPKAAEQEPATETVDEAAQDEAPAVEYSEVKRLILGISSKIGRDAATKLLGEFGVEKGPDLKPADYAAFVAKAEPLLEKANG